MDSTGSSIARGPREDAAELLRSEHRESLGTDGTHHVETIIQASFRIRQLVDSLADLARVEPPEDVPA